MKIILGHDMVVQDMEGSCWEALKILLLLQEQTSEMDICFIHNILEVFLFLGVGLFGLPPLTSVVQIRPKTDGLCSLLSLSDSSLTIS